MIRKMIRASRSGLAKLNNEIPKPVKVAIVAVGIVGYSAASRATGDSLFDVSTLYTGADTAFTAAATLAGSFLAIKYGAKMVKKAWAWLT